MPVPSLKAMATRVAQRRINDIDDLGDMPWLLAEPILRKIQKPAQLIKIQEKSPHLAEKTEPLWIEFIKRDIPSWTNDKVFPKNKKLWWKVYRKLLREQEQARDKDIADLAAANLKAAQNRAVQQPVFIQAVLPDPDPLERRQINFECDSHSGKGRSPTKPGTKAINAIRKATANSRLSRGIAPSKYDVPRNRDIGKYFKLPSGRRNAAEIGRLTNGMVNRWLSDNASEVERNKTAIVKSALNAVKLPAKEAPLPTGIQTAISNIPLRPQSVPLHKSSTTNGDHAIKTISPTQTTTPGASIKMPITERRSSTTLAILPPPKPVSPIISGSPVKTLTLPENRAEGSLELKPAVPSAQAIAYKKRRRAPNDIFMPPIKRART